MTCLRWTWAASVFVALVCFTVGSAVASDLGPSQAVIAIRHDLSLLLAAPLEDLGAETGIIDWVVTDSRDAVAMWHAGKNRGIVALQLHSGHWWWRGAATSTANMAGEWSPMSTYAGSAIPGAYCSAHTLQPPSAHDLLSEGFVDEQLASELATHLPTRPMPRLVAAELVLCDPSELYAESDGPYGATFQRRENYSVWFLLEGRTAQDWERASNPDSLPYYIFILKNRAASNETGLPNPLSLDNATFYVWFPYVLPNKRYTFDLRGVTPEIHEFPGALKNNVLYFKLPPFTVPLGAVAHGEIDGSKP